MERVDRVIAELEAARQFAIARFASEVEMPVHEFLQHFRVGTETPDPSSGEVSFRVEPIES